MSYRTLEVELDHGRVHPNNAEALPDRAHALLTILSASPTEDTPPGRSLGEAMRELKVVRRGNFTDLSTNKQHLDDFGK